MSKQNPLTEILNKIEDLRLSEYGESIHAELESLNEKEKNLDSLKKRLQNEADSMQELYTSLLNCSQTYNKVNLKLEKREMLKTDPKIIKLNEEFKQRTGYSSPYYLKYSCFSNLACKKIREIEINMGLEE